MQHSLRGALPLQNQLHGRRDLFSRTRPAIDAPTRAHERIAGVCDTPSRTFDATSGNGVVVRGKLRAMRSFRSISALALVLLAGSAFAQPPEPDAHDDDGLVRVQSSRKGAVYRSPDVRFERYKKVSFDAVTVTFHSSWRREYPRLTESEVERIRSRAATQFREELERELVKRAHYTLAEKPAPDVLHIKARIVEFDQKSPNTDDLRGLRTYARTAGDMVLIVELYDAASGVLVGRIVDPEKGKEYNEPQLIDRIFVEAEAQRSFANAAQLTREALNVAITERPRP
jgi:hypothetical protein